MQITLDTFVISDTHFGHENILAKEPSRLSELKSSNYKTFDDLSVRNWNDVVGSEDSVLHLGDLYFKKGKRYLELLNGKKILVVGNNDIKRYQDLKSHKDWKVIKTIKFKLENKQYFKARMKEKWGEKLDDVYANALITKVDKYTVMFSHFPVHERRKNERYSLARDILDYVFDISKCDLNIHGHLHSRDSQRGYCINVSMERTAFKPLRLKDVINDFRF